MIDIMQAKHGGKNRKIMTKNCDKKINRKVKKFYEDSLDLIPSPSPLVKIQIIGEKV